MCQNGLDPVNDWSLLNHEPLLSMSSDANTDDEVLGMGGILQSTVSDSPISISGDATAPANRDQTAFGYGSSSPLDVNLPLHDDPSDPFSMYTVNNSDIRTAIDNGSSGLYTNGNTSDPNIALWFAAKNINISVGPSSPQSDVPATPGSSAVSPSVQPPASTVQQRLPTNPRYKTKVACVHCARHKLGCDFNRPCQRCVDTGKPGSCVDRAHVRRRRAAERGNGADSGRSAKHTRYQEDDHDDEDMRKRSHYLIATASIRDVPLGDKSMI
jgi:hypothetical protein